jgi:hypothetical protein
LYPETSDANELSAYKENPIMSLPDSDAEVQKELALST